MWSAPGEYEIRIEGHLSERWASWFDELAVRHEGDGEGEPATTVLAGSLVDQSALYGVLMKVRDLGLSLIDVSRLESRKE